MDNVTAFDQIYLINQDYQYSIINNKEFVL